MIFRFQCYTLHVLLNFIVNGMLAIGINIFVKKFNLILVGQGYFSEGVTVHFLVFEKKECDVTVFIYF